MKGLEAAKRNQAEQAMFFINSCLFLAIVEDRKDLMIVYYTDFAMIIFDDDPEGSLAYLNAAFQVQHSSVDDVSVYDKIHFLVF